MQEQEVVWSDITDLFKSASSSLTHKEPMIYHESFSLFEAMSAVEIMDPKMDQRFNLSSTCQNQDDILNLQCHKLSDDFNRQTLASLLKSLIPLEVAYMDGFSVLETTHNCIGLWEKTWNFPIQPENLFWSIFITYCKATNQTINYVKSAILDAEIYEEEDFQPATSGFICSTLNNDDIISSLAGYIVSSQSLDNVPIIIPTLLDFKSSQILLYKVISDWIRFNVQHRNPSRQQLGLGDKAIDFASKTNILIESAREKLGRLQSIDTTPFEGEEESIQSAFSADLIKLVQTTPTRTVLKKPFNDCPTYFATLLDELSQLVTTFKELCAGEEAVDFEKLLQLALGYSRKHFHVLSRSLLKSFFDYFSPQMPALVHRSMKQRGIPLEYIEDELVKVRWSEVICKLAKETLNVLAGNRSKLLVRLDNILGSWGMIGSEAPYVDQQVLLNRLSNQPQADTDKIELQDWFTSFIMIPTVLLMDLEMELLIEMDLLSLNELGYFYWYWDYICASHSWALERLRSLKSQEHAAQTKRKKAMNSTTEPGPLLPSIEELGILAKMQICRGQLRMIFVAQSTGAIITDDVSHTTWEKKFEQRFRAFHNVTNPPLLTFETYERLLQSGFPHKSPSSASDRQLVSIVPTLQAASACYLRGRQYLDAFRGTGVNKGGIQLPCVSAGDAIFKASSNVLYKVVVANSVNVTKVLKLLEELSENESALFQLSVQKQYHLHYPVFELQRL